MVAEGHGLAVLMDSALRGAVPSPAEARKANGEMKMRNYTHYSLFRGTETVADFASLEEAGGLPQILDGLHSQLSSKPNMCVGTGEEIGTLHPGAGQVSFSVGPYLLILMEKSAVLGQCNELIHERNFGPAKKAAKALRD
jgi:hypothetical protein